MSDKIKIGLGPIKFKKDELNSLLTKRIRRTLDGAFRRSDRIVQNITRDVLKDTDFYLAFRPEHPLMGQLGIPVGEEHDRINAIIEAVSKYVKLDFTRAVGSNQYVLQLTIEINIPDVMYDYVNQLESANITTDNDDVLPWHQWVTEEGDKVIIAEYHVQPLHDKGRSTIALMLPGGAYSVDARYSGTIDNNWITRAVTTALPLYTASITEIFNEELGKLG